MTTKRIENLLSELEDALDRGLSVAREDKIKKCITVKVCKGLVVQKGNDGYWLSFLSGGKHALINIENTFPPGSIVHLAIMNWVSEMLSIPRPT